jgi:hypothetical protein
MTNLIDSGFIKLQRKILEWEWYDDIPTKTLFIHLLLKANFKDKTWRGILIKRGEFLTGRKELSKETGLSEQQIKTALNKLKLSQEIAVTTTNKFSIIKVENYCDYQDKKIDSNQQIEQPTTNDQTTIKQQSTTTKNEKKEKKEVNSLIESQFKELWNEYKILHTPKGNKEKALDKFKKLLSKNKFEDIIRGTKIYIKNCHTKNIYTKQVISFLNGETWKEYLEIDTQSNTEQRTTDLINKMINATLINRISIKNSNLACFHTTKENKEKLNNLPEDQKQEIRKIVKDSFGIKEIEYIY